jgi:hypothetical protein
MGEGSAYSPGEPPACHLTCVGVDMVPQQSDGAESLQTEVAHVGLLTGVSFHVAI